MVRTWRIGRTWQGAPVEPGEQCQISARFVAGGLVVEVDAPWHGDPPPPGPPGPCWGLWNHEVVELFLGCGARYTEIELGPHGHCLVLMLLGPRRVVRREAQVRYRAQRVGARWRGQALVPRAAVPCAQIANAYAIHGQGAARRYLAARPLGGPRPDFHRLSHFPASGLALNALENQTGIGL